jgi:hypothetical protein
MRFNDNLQNAVMPMIGELEALKARKSRESTFLTSRISKAQQWWREFHHEFPDGRADTSLPISVPR